MNIVIVVYIVFWGAVVGGWVANIYKLLTCNIPLAEFTFVETLRILGIFVAPLGSVLGYF